MGIFTRRRHDPNDPEYYEDWGDMAPVPAPPPAPIIEQPTVDARLFEAARELSQKTRLQIEAETAWKWAARAIVTDSYGRIVDASTYWGEALEHAALADATGAILAEVRAWMRQYIPEGTL
jgi:hypothetical protein